MKKIVLIPDSFKGTLSSKQICEIVSAEITQQFPNCEIISIPVADGGEGSVDCFLSALGGEKITAMVSGPHLEKMESYFGYLPESSTAVIEMASCAGLPLVENQKDPLGTTTYGVGELLLEAASHGVTKIILGLGGSCTTDGGCGAAAACGVKFYDKAGNNFIPTGGTLSRIEHIDISGLNPVIKTVDIVAMCDIENPMYGPEGAAYIFAPQKGATENEENYSMRVLSTLLTLENKTCAQMVLLFLAQERQARWVQEWLRFLKPNFKWVLKPCLIRYIFRK